MVVLVLGRGVVGIEMEDGPLCGRGTASREGPEGGEGAWACLVAERGAGATVLWTRWGVGGGGRSSSIGKPARIRHRS